eukprot:5118619-Amphidinium_carterae.1
MDEMTRMTKVVGLQTHVPTNPGAPDATPPFGDGEAELLRPHCSRCVVRHGAEGVLAQLLSNSSTGRWRKRSPEETIECVDMCIHKEEYIAEIAKIQ